MSQDNILSISSLNLHSPKNWKIVARVKYLSEPEDGKTGKYFYVDLCDSTGEIRAIAFNLEAYRFHSIFKENANKNIYYSIENGIIQTINEDFRNYNGLDNDFEIKLFKRSIVKENELNNNVRNGKYNAVKTIHSKEKDSSVASQSQHSELIEELTQKSIAIDKREIDKRQKIMDILDIELAIKKLDLGYLKEKGDLVKKLNHLNNQ
ncbi:replication protein A 70 kDa DNA-binding subunit-like [Myzus persicae]|uniref:replication protein A 70 kDa DNA-binding subunit-like n=1 Tax=Myzus persicae TaxID=13164 RepID=UPI000B930916|nr:replication protein A 70 kDa DNA-binding subunit-like [Myzus persicae]